MPVHAEFGRGAKAGPDVARIDRALSALRSGLMRIDVENSSQSQEVGRDGTLVDYISFRSWEWPQGVGLFSLWRLYEATGDQSILEDLKSWFLAMIETGVPQKNINTCAPMQTMVLLAGIDEDPTYLDLIEEWAEWVMNDLPRTPFGGFQHLTSNDDNALQLWDDTLFMTVLFLMRAGKLLDRPSYLDEALRQFLVHDRFLNIRTSGLWGHGFGFDAMGDFGAIPWARGNCWITVFIPEFLEIAEVSPATRAYIKSVLEAQVDTLLPKIDPQSGLWPTLLDEPESYPETSASAGFVAGILRGYRQGLLSEEGAQIAMGCVDALLDQVADDGKLRNVSYGTALSAERTHYRNIPFCQNAYGQGLMILALTEARRYLGGT